MDNKGWKERVQSAWGSCQEEVKRTTCIGKKMFSASKTNSCLHESFEELGKLVKKELDSGNLEWSHPQIDNILQKINECQLNLNDIEQEMNKIRFSSAPEDITKSPTDNPSESKDKK